MIWKIKTVALLGIFLWAAPTPALAQVKIFNGNSGTVTTIDRFGTTTTPAIGQTPPNSTPAQKTAIIKAPPKKTVVHQGPVTITTEPAPDAAPPIPAPEDTNKPPLK